MAAAQKPAAPEPSKPPRSTPGGDPWPHATRWVDRPIASPAAIPALEASTVMASPAPVLPVLPVLPVDSVVTPAAPMPEPVPAAVAPAFEPAPTAEPPSVVEAAADLAPEVASLPEPDTLVRGSEPERAPDQAQLPPPVTVTDPGRHSIFEPAPGIATRRPAASTPESIAASGGLAPAAEAPATPVRPEPLEPAKTPVYIDQAGPMWPGLGGQWTPQEQPTRVWPAPTAAVPSPAILSARAAAPSQSASDVWAQSSQPVLNSGSVRVCHRCGLPLSTHARFCRRCGTSQI
jgi:hypothetical protein